MDAQLRVLFESLFLQRSDLEVLGTGTYNKNYIVNLSGQKLILRIPQDCAQYDLRTLEEPFVLKILKDFEFNAGPRLVFASKHPRFMILEYIDGFQLPPNCHISKCISILDRIHDLIPSSETPIKNTTPLEKRFRQFGRLQMSRFSHILETSHSKLSAELVEEEMKVPFSDCVSTNLLHGDPSISNFIIDNIDNISIIDFELAGFGDPLLDYALLLSRAFPRNAFALKEVILFTSAKRGDNLIDTRRAMDLLRYGIVDAARSIHVVAAKFLDPSSPLYAPQRGEDRLQELLDHRSMLKATLREIAHD